MKFFLVSIFLIMSCSSNKFLNDSDIVIGIAKNEKYGAVLHANNNIYAIAGLKNWDSTYVNKKMKVTGSFQLRVGDDKVEIKNLGTFQSICQYQVFVQYCRLDILVRLRCRL